MKGGIIKMNIEQMADEYLSTKLAKSKQQMIWLSPPIINLLRKHLIKIIEKNGEIKNIGRGGGFSAALGDVVERYDILMKLTPIPKMTDIEIMIIGEVICGSVLSTTTVKYMDESVLDCITGTKEERKILSDKVKQWTIVERLAAIESLNL